MAAKKHKPEEIIGKLREVEIMVGPRVNLNGGAIALGHPLEMSGARIVMTAVDDLHRMQGRYALAFMCSGVG